MARQTAGAGAVLRPASRPLPGSLPQVCVQFIHYAQPHWRNTNCPTKHTACSSLDTDMQGQARSCGSQLAREGDCSSDEFLRIALASSRASEASPGSLPQVCVQFIHYAQPHWRNTNCPTKHTACSSLDTGMQGQARSCGSELAREGDGSGDEFLRIALASSRVSSLPQVCVWG